MPFDMPMSLNSHVLFIASQGLAEIGDARELILTERRCDIEMFMG